MENILRPIGIFTGNTIGALIDYTCPKCGKKSKICEYGGNAMDGNSTCPKCGECINGWNNSHILLNQQFTNESILNNI